MGVVSVPAGKKVSEKVRFPRQAAEKNAELHSAQRSDPRVKTAWGGELKALLGKGGTCAHFRVCGSRPSDPRGAGFPTPPQRGLRSLGPSCEARRLGGPQAR